MKKTWISIAALATLFTLVLAGTTVAEEPVCPGQGERIGLAIGPRDGSGQGQGRGGRHGLRDGSGSGQRLQARDGSGAGEGRGMQGAGNGQGRRRGAGGNGQGRRMDGEWARGQGQGQGLRQQLRDGSGCGMDPADCPYL